MLASNDFSFTDLPLFCFIGMNTKTTHKKLNGSDEFAKEE